MSTNHLTEKYWLEKERKLARNDWGRNETTISSALTEDVNA